MPKSVIQSMIMLAAVAALAVTGATSIPSPAQARPLARHHFRARHRVPARIIVTPGRLLYRRCVDWLELQHRPSGTVLFPKYRCWWVRG